MEGLINDIDDNYFAQIQFQMLVTGYEVANYAGFDPRLPEKLQLYWVPIFRDEKMIIKLKEGIIEVNTFIDGFLMEHGLSRHERPIGVYPSIINHGNFG